MFEIDKSRFKGTNKTGIIFTIVGLLLVVVMIVILINMTSKKNGMDRKTTATGVEENYHTNSDGDDMYSPIFYYDVKGETYACKSSVSSSFKPSKDTTVYYDSKNPSSCITDYDLSSVKYIYIGIFT